MKRQSVVLVIATVLSTVYTIYLFWYFFGTTSSASGEEAVAGAIASALVFPHMLMFLVGSVFGWIGVFLRKSWAALVAAILYSVGTLFFLAYAMFGVPILVLGFFGYANQNKKNKGMTSDNSEH